MSAHSASAVVPVSLCGSAAPVSGRTRGADLCYHCDAPNPPHRRWQEVVAGAPREFCCAGCLAVAQTIDAAGLASFYATRVQAPLRPDLVDADEWSRWDD